MSRDYAMKFTTEPCPRCGAAERIVNPAWLRYQRKAADVTMRQFAGDVGFSAAFICDVEHGRRNCSPKLLDAYEALGSGVRVRAVAIGKTGIAIRVGR